MTDEPLSPEDEFILDQEVESTGISIDDPEVLEAGIAEMNRLKMKLRYYGNQIIYAMSSPRSITPGLLERIVEQYEGQLNKFEAPPLTQSFDMLKGKDVLDPDVEQAWHDLGVTLLHMGRTPNG